MLEDVDGISAPLTTASPRLMTYAVNIDLAIFRDFFNIASHPSAILIRDGYPIIYDGRIFNVNKVL